MFILTRMVKKQFTVLLQFKKPFQNITQFSSLFEKNIKKLIVGQNYSAEINHKTFSLSYFFKYCFSLKKSTNVSP